MNLITKSSKSLLAMAELVVPRSSSSSNFSTFPINKTNRNNFRKTNRKFEIISIYPNEDFNIWSENNWSLYAKQFFYSVKGQIGIVLVNEPKQTLKLDLLTRFPPSVPPVEIAHNHHRRRRRLKSKSRRHAISAPPLFSHYRNPLQTAFSMAERRKVLVQLLRAPLPQQSQRSVLEQFLHQKQLAELVSKSEYLDVPKFRGMPEDLDIWFKRMDNEKKHKQVTKFKAQPKNVTFGGIRLVNQMALLPDEMWTVAGGYVPPFQTVYNFPLPGQMGFVFNAAQAELFAINRLLSEIEPATLVQLLYILKYLRSKK